MRSGSSKKLRLHSFDHAANKSPSEGPESLEKLLATNSTLAHHHTDSHCQWEPIGSLSRPSMIGFNIFSGEANGLEL